MNRIAPLAAVWLLASPVAAEQDEVSLASAIASSGLEPYSGTVEVEIFPPEGGGRLRYEWGEATAHFSMDENGRMAASVRGSIEEENDIGFELLLEEMDNGSWRSVTDEWQFFISSTGVISGYLEEPGQSTTIAGRVDPAEMRLSLELTVKDETAASSLAAGSTFAFEYTLRRPGAEDQAASSGCARIAWRLQATPNLWGGAMDLISVPYCVAE